MKKVRLLKSILIPTLAISAIGSITAVCTSCGNVSVTVVELNKSSTTLTVGKTETLTATVLPTNATNKDVTWTSSKLSVATVDSNGKITAVSEGIATITVKTNDGGKTATCRVTVDTIHVTSVTLNKTSTTLAVDDTETLTAIVLPSTATDKSVTWTSNKPSIATVENGTITAKGLGNATVTVTSVDNPSAKATCEVNVDTIHVTSVTLDKTSTSLDVGVTETLTATVLPETATEKSVTWTSSDESVATVNSEGTITAVSEGTAIITATSVDNPSAKATCVVNVTFPYVIITANEDSTLTFKHEYVGSFPDLQYSTDGGTNWSPYSTPINITKSQNLYLKGDNPDGWSHSSATHPTLSIIGDVSISGNVMGLLDNGTETIKTIPCNYCFCRLFQNSPGITGVSEDFLPATNLKSSCYFGMFDHCTSLIVAPELPATTLANGCYYGMFDSCSSLITAPELPATNLPLFCYYGMFYGCSSLTTAPDLPATSLAGWCYYGMFYGCSSLNSIKIGYTGNYDSDCFGEWVNGVASIGAFYYNGSDTLENFGFPEGWTKTPF